MAKPVISLKGVTKRYGSSRGITNVNLDVKPGEVFGFLGPNGAGKTTAIRTMLDIIRPTKGNITIFGLDSTRDSVAIHKRVGYLSGDMELDRQLTGKQYLDYIANLYGTVKKQKIDALIARLQCETDRKIKHLSRGNKQKVGLIAALMHDPDLLVMDEPTSGLDPLIQAEFNDIIREHTASGKTAFISSHILSEVQSICDRVAFIREGELITVKSVQELLGSSFKKIRVVLNKPADSNVLKSMKNISESRVDGDVFTAKFIGDLQPLLQALVKLKPKDVYIEEPHLEDLFMHYYEDTET